MIIKCEKHGETEMHPNENREVLCPQCLKEAIQRFNSHAEVVQHVDKAKPGTEMNGVTVITGNGEVLGSIQSFVPSDQKVLERVYNLEKSRGSYSMGCAVQGHMPCKLCEPGQRAEGTEPEVKKEPSQYEQFLEGLKKADLIESYRMTGEDTAEVKMKHVVNWINRVGWSRLEPG